MGPRPPVKQAVTAALSLETMMSLLQVGVADICYSRQLLREEDFVEAEVDGIPKQATKMIRYDSDASIEARTIHNWINQGVRSALAERYVRKIVFGISSDSNCIDVLEEYSFKLKHDANGEFVSLDFDSKQKGISSAEISPTPRDVKAQVIRLLRHLIGITKTLDPVPDSFNLFMKLQYCDKTPEEYEPPHFQPAGDRAVGYFPTRPYATKLGHVVTPYHTMDLDLRSTLDTVDCVQGLGKTADDISRINTSLHEEESTEITNSVAKGSQRTRHSCFGAINCRDINYARNDADLADELFTQPQSDGECMISGQSNLVDRNDGKDVRITVNPGVYKDNKINGRFDACSWDINNTRNGPTTSMPASCAGGIHSMPGSSCTFSQANPNANESMNTPKDKKEDVENFDSLDPQTDPLAKGNSASINVEQKTSAQRGRSTRTTRTRPVNTVVKGTPKKKPQANKRKRK